MRFIILLSTLYFCQAREYKWNALLNTCLTYVTGKTCQEYGYKPILNQDECQKAVVSLLFKNAHVRVITPNKGWENPPSCSYGDRNGLFNPRKIQHKKNYKYMAGEGSCSSIHRCICKTHLKNCPDNHVFKKISTKGIELKTVDKKYNTSKIFTEANLTESNSTFVDNTTDLPMLTSIRPIPIYLPPNSKKTLRGLKPMLSIPGSKKSSEPHMILKSQNSHKEEKDIDSVIDGQKIDERSETWLWYRTHVKDNLEKVPADEQQGDYHVRPDCSYNNVNTWLDNLDGTSEAFTYPIEKTYSIEPEVIRGTYGQITYLNGWQNSFKSIDLKNVDDEIKFSADLEAPHNCRLEGTVNWMQSNWKNANWGWVYNPEANDLWDYYSYHQEGYDRQSRMVSTLYENEINETVQRPWRSGEYFYSYKFNEHWPGYYWKTWFNAWDWYQWRPNCFSTDGSGKRLEVAIRFGWDLIKHAAEEETKILWTKRTAKNVEHLKMCFNKNTETLNNPSGAIFQISSDETHVFFQKKAWSALQGLQGFSSVQQYQDLFMKLQEKFEERLEKRANEETNTTCIPKRTNNMWDWTQMTHRSEEGGVWSYSYHFCLCDNGYQSTWGTECPNVPECRHECFVEDPDPSNCPKKLEACLCGQELISNPYSDEIYNGNRGSIVYPSYNKLKWGEEIYDYNKGIFQYDHDYFEKKNYIHYKKICQSMGSIKDVLRNNIVIIPDEQMFDKKVHTSEIKWLWQEVPDVQPQCTPKICKTTKEPFVPGYQGGRRRRRRRRATTLIWKDKVVCEPIKCTPAIDNSWSTKLIKITVQKIQYPTIPYCTNGTDFLDLGTECACTDNSKLKSFPNDNVDDFIKELKDGSTEIPELKTTAECF